ncbi:MAG: PKD domain-containing protein [Bacteroidia bacterium]
MKPFTLFLLLSIILFEGCKKGTSDDDIIKPVPTVDFTFSTGDGFAPDTIQFTNQSKDADSYQWDFGDGISSSETSPSHIFQNPGTYNVKLTGTNSTGFSYVIKSLTVEPDTELISSINYLIAEGVFANVFAIIQETASVCNSGILNSCGNITKDTVSVPHILTIDFGTANCIGADQKLRRGKIIVSYPGHFDDSASVHQVSFTNFYESNHHITGTISIANNGHNSSGRLNYSLNLIAKIFLSTSPDSIIWNAQRTIEWTQGESSPANCLDDVYNITGTATGILFRGKAFSSSITTALQKQIICPPIVIGKIILTPQGKSSRIIDFGNGTCDLTATVSLNGKNSNIPVY